MTAESGVTAMTEPKDLMEVLERLERARQEPTNGQHRSYKRHPVRGDARLEPLSEDPYAETVPILLRDISRGGVGFLSEQQIEPGSLWRIRFQQQGRWIGSQAIAVRHCRLIQSELYLVGGQFVIEPYILQMVGVPERELAREEGDESSGDGEADFLAPEADDA